jgi:hypothetical protein
MFDKLKNIKIPKRTVIIQLSWLGALLILGLVVIFPVQRSTAGLDGQIKEIRIQMEEQKTLQPIYQALKAKSRTPAASILPAPESAKLSKDLVRVVPSTMRRIAKNSDMEMISVSPDVAALADQSRHLLVRAVLRGDFMNFRKFLTGIGELPYLERIEEIEIQQDPNLMEFRIKMRLMLGESMVR